MPAKQSASQAAETHGAATLAFAVGAALFHLLLFVWVGWQVRPAAAFERNGPLFFLTGDFLGTVTSQPGGWLNYLAAAWAQLDYANWLGAGGFTVIAALAFVVTRLVWGQLTGSTACLVSFVPPMLLLWLRQQPGHSATAAGLGFIVALSAALATGRLPGKPAWVWSLLVAAFSPLLAYGAGFWPWMLCMATVVWIQARSRARWTAWAGLLVGAAAAAAVLLAAGVDPAGLLKPWHRKSPTGPVMATYLWLPVLALLFGLHAAVARRIPAWRRIGIESTAARRSFSALLALAAVTGSWLSFDQREHLLAGLEYAASRGNHADVLRLAARLPTLPPEAEVRLHRSLYHSGRLLSDLFACTNQVGWELLPGMEGGADAARAQAETLLELGQVNEAEHMAHEVIEFDGDRPDMLRLLADVNVLKDRPEAARVFLRVLRGVPAHRNRAAARLKTLEADTSLARDSRISAIRACLVSTDLPHDGMPTATLLEQLLHSNPRNRMALEYLLAHRLITLDLERFITRLPALQQFGYAALPRHCEEAVLLYQVIRPNAPPAELPQVRPETRERFQAWLRALEAGALRTEDGRRNLVRQFGDTYWHYHLLRMRTEPPTTSLPPS